MLKTKENKKTPVKKPASKSLLNIVRCEANKLSQNFQDADFTLNWGIEENRYFDNLFRPRNSSVCKHFRSLL